jgi:hypothetical protein
MDITSSIVWLATYLIDLRGSAGLAPAIGEHAMEGALLYDEH